MTARRRTSEILEPGNRGDLPSALFDYGILLLIIANVIAIMLESVSSIEQRYSAAFAAFEWISVAIFTVEYLARIWTAVELPRYQGVRGARWRFLFTPMAVIDLLAILPFYLPFVGVDLRSLRVLRLMRIFRIVKVARYSRSLTMLGRAVYGSREQLMITVFALVILLVIASSLMHYAEPERFESIPHAMWWGIATLTTVGYGDIYPMTGLGRLIAGVIALMGVAVFAIPAGILSGAFYEELRKQDEHETRSCPHCGGALEK